MKLKQKDLFRLMELAKDRLLALPGQARLVGMKQPLSEGERLALAYLEATLNLVSLSGTTDLAIEIDDSES